MAKVLLISAFCLLVGSTVAAAAAVTATKPNVVCYFANWAIYRNGNASHQAADIDPNLCTHVIFAFVGLNAGGHVWNMDSWESDWGDGYGLNEIAHLVDLKKINPNLKLILGMGGWNECETDKYSIVAANPAQRKSLIDEVIAFIDERGFDGFDLDWEYPCQRSGKPEDRENFITLLKELKEALSAKGYILSVAVAGGGNSVDLSYDVPEVSKHVDLINVMSYDFHGAFDSYVGHHAPLTASSFDRTPEDQEKNVKAGIEKWINLGADPQKLNLGIGLYGRSFTLEDPKNTSLYAPAYAGSGGPYLYSDGILGYNEICKFFSDWPVIWDEEQQVPHKLSGNQWVGYDNVDSINLKIQYAKSRNLGGAMVWSLDTDDFKGECGGDTYPLLRAINKALKS